MRKVGLVGAGALLLFAMNPAIAQADNGPHQRNSDLTTDACAGCHRAHTAQGSYLLKSSEASLCYTCHGGANPGSTTNVQNGFGTGSNSGALRSGGFDNALIDADNPYKPMSFTTGTTSLDPAVYAPVASHQVELTKKVPALATGAASTSKHGVDAGSNTGTIWGNGAISATANYGKANVTLTCGSCHDPHGNGNYRILKPVPNDSGVAAASGINIADSTGAKVYTTTNYWSVDTTDTGIPTGTAYYPIGSATAVTGAQTSFIMNISAWCSTCHTRYQAAQGSWSTDSGDAVFKYRHTSDMNYTSAPNYGTDAAPRSPSQSRTCVQCHVAHGSNAAMTGYAGGTAGNAGANPDGTVNTQPSKLLRVSERGTCRMCHSQGIAPGA